MNKKAFTLIELIVVIVIIGIVAGLAVSFVVGVVDSWFLSKVERDLVFNGRLALNRMVREIRQIRDVDDIDTFTDTQFKFTDINDNVIDFQQSGTLLLRNDDELANNLKNTNGGGLAFTYFDSDSSVTAVQADVRMVQIKLVLESGGISVTVRSLARFRNT